MDKYLHLRDFRKIKEKGTEILFKEIMSEKFSLPGDKNRHPDPESPQIPNKMNQRDSHGNMIKLSELKDKERNLKATKESNLILSRESG